MKKLYVLFQDTVGGRLFIEETEDDDFTYQELGGCHANNIFESEDEDEVLRKYDEIIESETIYVVARGCETNRIDIITLRPDEGTIQEALLDLSSYYMEQFKEVCICNSEDELRKKGYRLEDYQKLNLF